MKVKQPVREVSPVVPVRTVSIVKIVPRMEVVAECVNKKEFLW